jgi:putative hydrolase of HD superfamily
MKMALVHDMAEALVGDITPVDGVTKTEKNRREASTMNYFTNRLLGNVNGGMTGKDLNDAWQEYEDNETLESKFVHDVDKMELVLQMLDYEKAHNCQIDLGEFSWVASRIQLPEVQKWADEVLEEREKVWAGRAHTTYADKERPDAAVHVAKQEEYYGNGSK